MPGIARGGIDAPFECLGLRGMRNTFPCETRKGERVIAAERTETNRSVAPVGKLSHSIAGNEKSRGSVGASSGTEAMRSRDEASSWSASSTHMRSGLSDETLSRRSTTARRVAPSAWNASISTRRVSEMIASALWSLDRAADY